MLRRFLTGEFGIRKVLFDDVAELGVNTGPPPDKWLFAEEVDGPKMEELGAPAGVVGWAISVKRLWAHAKWWGNGLKAQKLTEWQVCWSESIVQSDW